MKSRNTPRTAVNVGQIGEHLLQSVRVRVAIVDIAIRAQIVGEIELTKGEEKNVRRKKRREGKKRK